MHRSYDYTIELMNGKESKFDSLYDMFKDELQVLQKYLKKNLIKGFIKANSSEYSSLVLFVKKLGEGFRFCVDYRKLNAIIRKNRYPLPLVQETLDRLCKAKFSSTMRATFTSFTPGALIQ